jgi:hypothetical protein
LTNDFPAIKEDLGRALSVYEKNSSALATITPHLRPNSLTSPHRLQILSLLHRVLPQSRLYSRELRSSYPNQANVTRFLKHSSGSAGLVVHPSSCQYIMSSLPYLLLPFIYIFSYQYFQYSNNKNLKLRYQSRTLHILFYILSCKNNPENHLLK